MQNSGCFFILGHEVHFFCTILDVLWFTVLIFKCKTGPQGDIVTLQWLTPPPPGVHSLVSSHVRELKRF